MYKFSKKSKERLSTCHNDIILILNELIKIYDFSVLEGHRSKETQQQYFKDGKSTLDGVNKVSKHQSLPSMAVDLFPYMRGSNAFSGNEKDSRRFYTMMGMVSAIGTRLLSEGVISHTVRFGLDWDGDDTYRDQTFDDLPHFELVKTK